MSNYFSILLILSLHFVSCAEKQFNPDDPQGSFAMAREPYDDENYEIAVKKLGEYKSRFPYSRFATEAELLIAHSYFEMGKYAEASVAYEHFVKLHPKHPELELALFRIGMSYWKDAPEEIDREQEFTKLALEKWERLLKEHPQTSYAAEARGFMTEGRRRIAESERFAARFYCKQGIWHSCAYRYLKILEHYPENLELKEEAQKKASHALRKLANEWDENTKDKNLFFKDMTKDQILQKANSLTP
ncbi:MAG: outer membrane protein assembly factor BamD [Deltaproteobacteria bacterium]|nr:outer membrane protein assembly factor BamD [Deltaproteobacteria bacterium]